jgi:hypothetical protein
MGGHLFVTQGDLTRLACDAWLLPSDERLHVRPHWLEGEPGEARPPVKPDGCLDLPKPPGWGDQGLRVMRLAGVGRDEGAPQRWLVNVGGAPGVPVEWHLAGVRQFLDVVAAELRGRASVYGRAIPLVALPLVGTEGGGAGDVKGDMLVKLLQTLHASLPAVPPFDIALVTNAGHALAAAQSLRNRYYPESWSELGPGTVAHARQLAANAARGQLVLFLGSGVSVGAGLPAWDDLLARLADDARMSPREQAALTRMHAVDRARIIEGRLGGRSAVASRIKSLFDSQTRYSLAHSLLAALPVAEVATMNYDTLFERACAGVKRPVVVLPYHAAQKQERWLLKMHGCVTRPDDIVLTREDYIRYAERRAALAGIVQALLITRHMLFVGFSLNDDNFHRIADDVRRAIRPADSGPTAPFGTALLLREDSLMEELWKDDLQCVNMGKAQEIDVATAARRLEVFLDLLLAEATQPTAHILDRTYADALSGEETALRDRLDSFLRTIPPAVRHSAAWHPIERALKLLGYAE